MDGILTLNPGELRDRISFYTTSAIQDDAGGFPTSTQTLAFTKMAKVEPQGSIKTYEGEKTEYVETWKVRMRYEIGRVPQEKMIVEFKGDKFNILGIKNVKSRNLVLELVLAKRENP